MLMLLLFATGLFAGTVDAIAGGGGLISLPVLLSIGMPPHLAFGTNKLQGTLGTFAATLKYYRHGFISLKDSYQGLIFGLLGALLGAVLVQVISGQILRTLVPILLTLILIYTLISPRLTDEDAKPHLSTTWFYPLFGFALGIYDGFFGPGVGSLWVFALTYFLGYRLIKATAYTKLFNLNSSLIAMICFLVGGNIDYRIALCMAAGQLIGGRLGAHLAIKNGASIIRPLFLSIVAVTVATLGYKSYASSVLFAHITHAYGLVPQIVVGMVIISSFILIYVRQYIGGRRHG